MKSTLPYVLTPGVLAKILEKIREAPTPQRFTQDFLSTKLGFSGGGAMSTIPLLKKLGMLGADGVPTDIYTRFRNPTESRHAMAEAIRDGYGELFERNEFAERLSRDKLTSLVMSITGLDHDNRVVSAICQTLDTLKTFADFESRGTATPKNIPDLGAVSEQLPSSPEERSAPSNAEMRLGLSYTINLNLPETTNVEVFNAIFKSLKENLLSK